MILTITPNPALDLGGTVTQLVPDEKNYVHSETRYPGGNAINVARILQRLNIPVVTTGFLGKSVGHEVGALLDTENIKRQFVKIKDHTRISLTISNLKTHKQTRLSFPGPHVSDTEIQLLMKTFNKMRKLDLLVLGGSFPPGYRISDANQLIKLARARHLPVVVDIPGKLLREIQLEGLLLIKPNLVEFQELVGKKVKSISSVARLAQQLAQKVGLVCVSSVEGGALLVSRDFAWYGTVPKIKVRNTVGAGDSMVGAMTAELWRQKIKFNTCNDDFLLAEVLRQGLAAAAATLMVRGTQLGTAKNINHFLKKVSLRSIQG